MTEPTPYRAAPGELAAIDEALAERWSEYELTYGRPRLAGDYVLYEQQILRIEHADDQAALRWAREIVPHECGLMHWDREYLAAP